MLRWLFFTFAVFVLGGTSFGQCKGATVLKVSYEGVGMVINGKHLYLLVCESGEVEYDSGEFQTVSHRKRDRLTNKQQSELDALLNDKGTRDLNGTYAGTIGFRDHSEWVDVTIFRTGRQQEFTVLDFYGTIEKTYPSSLVTFLCRMDKLRTKTDWHISESFACSTD